MAITIVNVQSETETAALFATEQSHLDPSRLLSYMNREIERGNNINLTNLLTLLENVFPYEQQQADATLHQALLAATTHISQRDVQCRTKLMDQPTEADVTDTASTSASRTTSKENPSHGNGCSEP